MCGTHALLLSGAVCLDRERCGCTSGLYLSCLTVSAPVSVGKGVPQDVAVGACGVQKGVKCHLLLLLQVGPQLQQQILQQQQQAAQRGPSPATVQPATAASAGSNAAQRQPTASLSQTAQQQAAVGQNQAGSGAQQQGSPALGGAAQRAHAAPLPNTSHGSPVLQV